MMTKTMTTAAIALLSALAMATVASAGGSQQQEQIDKLTITRDRLAASEQAAKPNQAARMRGEAADLQRMIDQARAGKRLDPSQVDEAIRHSTQGF